MDILDAIAIELPCAACRGHDIVTLKEIELSQHMLHQGCPVPPQFTTECPPLYHAGLISREMIEEVQRTWLRLEESAEAAGGKLLLYGAHAAGFGDIGGRKL